MKKIFLILSIVSSAIMANAQTYVYRDSIELQKKSEYIADTHTRFNAEITLPEGMLLRATPAVKNWISEKLFGETILTDADFNLLLRNACSSFFNRYRSELEEEMDNPYFHPWAFDLKITVETDQFAFFTLKYEKYINLGGAHPSYDTGGATFIKENGKKLTWADIFKKKDFVWNMGINYSFGLTRLTSLSSGDYAKAYLDLYQKADIGASEYYFRVNEGGLIGDFYGYRSAGANENGDLLIYDNDGNTHLASEQNPEWKTVIGNGAPKPFLNWNNSWPYKNWDFSMMWRGAFDFVIYNTRKYGMGLQGCGADNILVTAYTKDKDVKNHGGVISDYFLERGDYFKLDNITIGYNIVAKDAKYFQNCRLYLTAKNICTITKYSGNDPSIVSSNGITPGVDNSSAYPTATQLALGITLNLK